MNARRRTIAIAALVGVAVCVLTAAAATGQGFKVVGKWGKIGTSGNGVFSSNTRGIAVDKSGLVYVADTDNNRVQVFTAKGGFLRKWGSIGSANGQFAGAEDVDIAPDGTVWVSDRGNERLQAFSGSGAFKAALELPLGEGSQGVAVDAGGDVLAAVESGKASGFRRYTETPTGWEAKGGLFGSMATHRADDIEASPDGTIYLVRAATQTSDDRVQRFSADGKQLSTFKLASGDGTRGLGIDLDCNVWTADTPNRRIAKHSPTGKVLATAAVPDLISNDIAVSPKGDVYAIHQNTGIVHFAENKAKPATAVVPGTITVVKGMAKIKFAATGIACPAQIAAVATLKGKGVSGKAAVKVAAGKVTVIEMKVKAPHGKTTPATFTIVLKTNGRPTKHVKHVQVKA